MIYVTSHAVRSRQFASREGVNAFIHRLDLEVSVDAEVSVAMEQISSMSGASPGSLRGCSIELPPGGNDIDAYLDLVLPEEDLEKKLAAALEMIRAQIGSSSANHVAGHLTRGCMFRFYASIQVEKQPAFDKLSSAALNAVRSPRPPPLRILLDSGDDETGFRLAPESVERLRKIHGPEWALMVLRVHMNAASDFEAMHGSILPHVIEAVTGLGIRHVEGLGGVAFETRAGEVLKTWPAAPWMSSEPSG